ncbi:ASKHA domain-containing protein [Thermoproteota archaeon]
MKKVTFISHDFVKEVDVQPDSNLLSVIRECGLFVEAPCGGQSVCKKCLVFTEEGKALFACKTTVKEDMTVVLPRYDDPLLRSKKTNLASDFIPKQIDPVVKNVEQVGERKDCKNLGIAIDIGTTTISIVLLDIESGDIIDNISFYNPQIIYGADIIHRIIFSQKGDGAKLLQKKIVDELIKSISYLGSKNEIDLREVKSVAISGNTTMIHLLLKLDAKYIREAPYSPIATEFEPFYTDENFNLLPKAKVFIAPCVANYLGGDIVSGVAVSGLHKRDETSILLDIGTNGEIVIGNKEWLVGCACSAGPAFEGMGLNCGTRFKEGAITEATICDNKFKYVVFGASKPCGISGSGIISLIKHLKEEGYIDNRGKFSDKVTQKVDHKKAFILFEAKDTVGGEPIYVTETDIDNILRAKAAIYSGMSLLLKKTSLDISNVDKFFIAGNLGSSINIESAIEIGLLPALPREKFSFIGNASLAGSIKYLLSKETRQDFLDIKAKTTYIDLSNEPAYMDEFMAALFIPHTDLNLFGK